MPYNLKLEFALHSKSDSEDAAWSYFMELVQRWVKSGGSDHVPVLKVEGETHEYDPSDESATGTTAA